VCARSRCVLRPPAAPSLGVGDALAGAELDALRRESARKGREWKPAKREMSDEDPNNADIDCGTTGWELPKNVQRNHWSGDTSTKDMQLRPRFVPMFNMKGDKRCRHLYVPL
jgi:hypothetical protein